MENNGKTYEAYDGNTYTFTPVKELILGVYVAGLNPPLSDYEHYPALGEIQTFTNYKYSSFCSYGVCDSYEQILEQCPEIVNSERKFVITLAEICKDDQPDEGGWRWCKWGEYIGVHEPQCEYLYDEPVVEKVFCYHIYEKISA